MKFDIETRFEGRERAEVLALLRASGSWSQGAAGEAGLRRMARSSARKVALAFPSVARKAALRLPGAPSLSGFRAAAEEITGQSLTCATEGELVRWTLGMETWSYPIAPEKEVLFAFLTAVRPGRWSRAKYTLPGFVDLEPGDVAIDCGSFVGGFSRAALDAGAEVVAVEPSRANRRCIAENLAGRGATVLAAGLGSTLGEMTFHESSTGVDSSFGELDEGIVTATYPVEVLTVDEVCRRVGMEATFLKLEAEGMEHAILQGMQDSRPGKIAVDATEGGVDDRSAVEKQLRSLGYTVRRDKQMVYGRL